MGGEDTVRMSVQELKRVQVIRQVMNTALRQREAGEVLGLTTRQVRRLIQRVRAEGDAGLVPRSRGTPSNRRYRPALKARALRLYAKHYRDLGPTLAAEKLAERHGITLSAETLRGWLRAAGVTPFQRRTRPHRAWRARKAHRGELVQLDGSHHDWFEGRGPRCGLMAYIDDASSQVFARLYAYEGPVPALDSFRRYVTHSGLPLALYTDQHTTYKSSAQPTVEEQLADRQPHSQFERSLAELGVTVIHAHSPQAKGRVERLFKTLQDRLVKDLRHDPRGRQSVPGNLAAAVQPAICGPARAAGRSPSASSRAPRPGPEPVPQDHACPAPRLDRGPPRAALSDPRPYPGHPGAGGRTDRWDDADHPPRPAAHVPGHCRAAPPGGGARDAQAAAAARQAPRGSSMEWRRDDRHQATGRRATLNRTFLLGEKADISKLG